ncbi:hypothetical protein, partial [Mesorhizobium sp. M1A.F.Ca.IN.022.07.1.1]|uniref:hypothetical protein n=1 Tax=Mesorhizobium sp. M1A.F.Ca.IN.022.07.1.1 TaxID=2496767 RepID=UPI0019D21A10
MVEVFAALLSQIAPYALAAGGALVAAVAWGFHQRMAGAKAERAKQEAEEAKARDVADQVQYDGYHSSSLGLNRRTITSNTMSDIHMAETPIRNAAARVVVSSSVP